MLNVFSFENRTLQNTESDSRYDSQKAKPMFSSATASIEYLPFFRSNKTRLKCVFEECFYSEHIQSIALTHLSYAHISHIATNKNLTCANEFSTNVQCCSTTTTNSIIVHYILLSLYPSPSTPTRSNATSRNKLCKTFRNAPSFEKRQYAGCRRPCREENRE